MNDAPLKIEEFLRTRVSEANALAAEQEVDSRIRRDVERLGDSLEVILELHSSWPTLIEAPSEIESSLFDSDSAMSQFRIQLTRRYDYVLAKDFQKRFGTEPPTAPFLRQIAELWSDHPDYDSSW